MPRHKLTEQWVINGRKRSTVPRVDVLRAFGGYVKIRGEWLISRVSRRHNADGEAFEVYTISSDNLSADLYSEDWEFVDEFRSYREALKVAREQARLDIGAAALSLLCSILDYVGVASRAAKRTTRKG